ncbi:hypothetical protein [Actinoplanes sp. G11-F43]|uniref:hypothetical protein n=1 Tax=Actinoplanes sp. G11-F43 TaxID=3424130 RepID=UPI003D33B722
MPTQPSRSRSAAPPVMPSAIRPANVGGSGRAVEAITTRLCHSAERAARKWWPASTGPPVRPSSRNTAWPARLRCISDAIWATSSAVSAGRPISVSVAARNSPPPGPVSITPRK